VDPFCSDVARAERAALAGTASEAELWLLVEHRGPWAARALEENDLPPVAASWLRDQSAALAALAPARTLFIRRPAVDAAAPLLCYLAVAQEDRRELFAFTADSPEDLAALSLADGLAAGALDAHRTAQRLTLICGNGRRDRCCARTGVPTCAALAVASGEDVEVTGGAERVWLSTHQGGHRHAAVGLWLPEGVSYGFLEPGDATALHGARRRRELYLPRYRGRPFHPQPVQAADALLREGTGIAGLDAWQLATAEQGPPDEWCVVFAGAAGRWQVRVARGEEEALVSCSPVKRQRIDRWSLRDWHRIGAAEVGS
jgi:hypothetical protein